MSHDMHMFSASHGNASHSAAHPSFDSQGNSCSTNGALHSCTNGMNGSITGGAVAGAIVGSVEAGVGALPGAVMGGFAGGAEHCATGLFNHFSDCGIRW